MAHSALLVGDVTNTSSQSSQPPDVIPEVDKYTANTEGNNMLLTCSLTKWLEMVV